MIVATSALITILRVEPEATAFAYALADSAVNRISAASYLEASIVAMRRDRVSDRRLDDLLREADTEVEPVTAAHARIARAAYRDYGKGSGHPAGLNFGDCFAYALAIDLREPLLCKGDDFAHTDVQIVPLS